MPYLLGFFSLLFLLIVISFVHEMGHYLTTLRCGAKVECFSIGFGKELFGYTDRRGCRWKFCPILLGGYVKMFDDDGDMHELGTFKVLSWYKRVVIASAGPLFNILFSLLVFFVLFSVGKVPHFSPVVGLVVEGSAAEEVGVKVGDRIKMVNDEPVVHFGDLSRFVVGSKKLEIVVDRGGESLVLHIEPRFSKKSGKMSLGLGSTSEIIDYSRLGPLRAARNAFGELITIFRGFFVSLFHALFPDADGNKVELRSIVGIASASNDMLNIGLGAFFWFMGALSINLGLFNILPVLPLDGGAIVLAFFSACLSRNSFTAFKKSFSVFGFVLVAMVILTAIYNDAKYLLTSLGL